MENLIKTLTFNEEEVPVYAVQFNEPKEAVDYATEEYLLQKERLIAKGYDPDRVMYYDTEGSFLSPFGKRVVARAFMSPATLREKNREALAELIKEHSELKDFRDSDILASHTVRNTQEMERIIAIFKKVGIIPIDELL